MRFIHSISTILAAVLCLTLIQISPVVAQSSADGLGRLAQFLPQSGQDQIWRYTNTGNSFEIENIGDPQAIQYFYVTPETGLEGKRRIEVGLDIHPDSTGAAGLLYGLNNDRSLYHVLTLNAQGVVTVYRRDGSGFRPLLEQSSDAFLKGKINVLSVQETGDEIEFALNGQTLGSIGGDLFGFGSTGIAAVGDVRAFFTRYSDGAMGDRTQVTPQSGTGTQTATGPSESIEVKPFQIVDTQGPAEAIVAYETLIPVDWKTQGGIKWSQQDGQAGCFTGARLIWGTGTQDEAYGMAFMDPISWGMSTNGPSRYMCLPQDLTDAEMVMRAYFQAISANLQVSIKDVQRPQELQPMAQMFGQAWKQSWPQANAWVDAIVVRAQVQSSTRSNDAYFIVVTKHVEAQYGQTTIRDGRTAMILGIFTPVGELDKGHPGFAAIMNNLRSNPQWQQVEAQWWAQKMQAAGNATRAALAKADTSVGDIMFEGWKRRQGISDAGHASTINGIWEVQPWQKPGGGTVLLNQDYNHAWQLDNGSIVLTNDANYNPMQSHNRTGQQMQRY